MCALVTGVQTCALPICIRVRRGCTFHGLAFNAAMDLEPFGRINPCGYAGLQVTSVLDLGGPSSPDAMKPVLLDAMAAQFGLALQAAPPPRSEEHTSELQSLMRISYAVFCLKKNNTSYVPHTTPLSKDPPNNLQLPRRRAT